MKTIKLGDVFTAAQLKKVRVIYSVQPSSQLAVAAIEREVTAPALAQINRRTGQQNDARYWAYAILFALQHASC